MPRGITQKPRSRLIIFTKDIDSNDVELSIPNHSGAEIRSSLSVSQKATQSTDIYCRDKNASKTTNDKKQLGYVRLEAIRTRKIKLFVLPFKTKGGIFIL